MSAPRLLLINPNTSQGVTEKLAQHVRAALGEAMSVEAVTASIGAAYIDSEASYAMATHATLEAYTDAPGAPPDAVLVGCFGDPGVFAVREVAKVPVIGLAEAAFIEGAARGRFAIVTGGARWAPMLERFARSIGYAPHVAGIRTVAPSGAQLAADPAGARRMLAQACAQAARETGADCVILGGAGLAGMAADIAPEVPVPVIDSVLAGARQIAALMRRD
jgi:Asp/Glu/hydantoin racemase